MVRALVTIIEHVGIFIIGCISSGAILFGSYMGLKDYQELPSRIFTNKNIFIYLFFSGAFSVILQLGQNSFAPLQALAVGAGWPAILLGHATSQSAKQIGEAQFKEIKEYMSKVIGEE